MSPELREPAIPKPFAICDRIDAKEFSHHRDRPVNAHYARRVKSHFFDGMARRIADAVEEFITPDDRRDEIPSAHSAAL